MKEKVTNARRRYRQAVRDAWMGGLMPTHHIARTVAARTGLPLEVVTAGVREEPARHGRILREAAYRRLVAAGGDDLAVMLGGGETA